MTTICILLNLLLGIYAVTHWTATENGLIESKVNSPFIMEKPHDLMEFLEQENRWKKIITMYHELSERQTSIHERWTNLEKDTNIDTQIEEDENCNKADPLRGLDWYVSIAEMGTTREGLLPMFEILKKRPFTGKYTIPDCEVLDLHFNMAAFEHLEAMVDRHNLRVDPEMNVMARITALIDFEGFGKQVAEMLHENKTSWFHFNLASLYWRSEGEALKAIECLRRAVTLVPRAYKDIVLLNLGSLLHKCKRTEDALIVLNAAYDHGPHYVSNNFALGNAYAVIGEFNTSLKHYDECLKIDPNFQLVSLNKHGLLCHKSLIKKVNELVASFQKLRADLTEYSTVEADWMQTQAQFLKTYVHRGRTNFSDMDRNSELMTELTGLDIYDLKKYGDRNNLIIYFLDGNPEKIDQWIQERGIDVAESMQTVQKYVNHIERHVNMISNILTKTEKLRLLDDKLRSEYLSLLGSMLSNNANEVTKLTQKKARLNSKDHKETKDVPGMKSDFTKSGTTTRLYPPTLRVRRNVEDFDREADWPSTSFCNEWLKDHSRNPDSVYPAFLPFENHGIRLGDILGRGIGVPLHDEHPLPWHPPLCPHQKEKTKSKHTRSHTVTVEDDMNYLRNIFLNYVGAGRVDLVKNMQDVEIGQRLLTAVEKGAAPKWILYTVSSLYWRLRRNGGNALACLRAALRLAPAQHRDIVLTSLASVYMEAGQLDAAFDAASKAFHLSLYEPSTNFVLAQLNMLKRNRNIELYHLKQVLRVDPNFMDGLGRTLLNTWACLQARLERPIEVPDEGVCADAAKRITCAEDGTDCRLTNVHCYKSLHPDGSSSPSNDGVEDTLDAKSSFQYHQNGDSLKNTELKEDTSEMVCDPQTERCNDKHLKVLDYKGKTLFKKTANPGRQRYYHIQTNSMSRTVPHRLRELFEECDELAQCVVDVYPLDFMMRENECDFEMFRGGWTNLVSLPKLLRDSNLSIPKVLKVLPRSETYTHIDCALPDDIDISFFNYMKKVDARNWDMSPVALEQLMREIDAKDSSEAEAKIANYIANYYLVEAEGTWMAPLVGGWWCGLAGRGECCVRCLTLALVNASAHHMRIPLLSLIAILHMQSRFYDAKELSFVTFRMSPKSKLEAFLVAISLSEVAQLEQATWMYRYALALDPEFEVARSCLKAVICLMLFTDSFDTDEERYITI